MFNVILSCKLKKMFDLGYMRAEREATVGYKKVDRRDLYEAILGWQLTVIYIVYKGLIQNKT